MKTLLKTLLIAALTIATLDAKGGGFSSSSRSFSSSSSRSFGSSSRSSFGSSSKSYGSSSKSYTAPSSSSNSAKYNGGSGNSGGGWFSKPGSSTPQTSTRVGSKVEVARYQSAVKSGKAFTTRESAVADFKAKNSNSFTNKFTSEPTKRPDYIPSNYTSGGRSYNIVYNQNVGGYGYWSGGGPGLGTWMLYDTLSDIAMMNTMMARQNYYVGQPVVTSSVGGFFTVVAWITGFVLIAILTVIIFTKLVD